MTNRKMIVQYEGEDSSAKNLVGGGPHGTLLGGIEFNVASDDSGKDLKTEDRLKYYDDMYLLEFICFAEKIVQYDYLKHIPSDIHEENHYLPHESFKMQEFLNNLCSWTDSNKMLLNVEKSNYMIFTRSKLHFDTRLTVNEMPLERKFAFKVLGVWLVDDLSWELNTKAICIKADSRISMLSKLKYAGISLNDLLTIYKLYIRSITEYCSIVFHSSLTQELCRKLETVQKTCLKVLLGSNYIDYNSAISSLKLDTLYERRNQRMKKFVMKCTNDKFNSHLFPMHENPNMKEKFKVNFARTAKYFNSTIPQCQRLLNNIFKNAAHSSK